MPQFDSVTKYKQNSDTSSSESEHEIHNAPDINLLSQDNSSSPGCDQSLSRHKPKQTWHDIAQSSSDSEYVSDEYVCDHSSAHGSDDG